MHIHDLLKLKIKEDLIRDLLVVYRDQNLGFNKKLYTKICLKKINAKTLDISFLKCKQIKDIDSNKRCCSRIWDDHRGSRCKYKRQINEEYCRHHLNMINKNGKLLFNRYDEDKPLYNAKNNIIPWVTESKINILDTIIQNQSDTLIDTIYKNLSKQRHITPKF